jgi:rRNA maturation RNase YbeY
VLAFPNDGTVPGPRGTGEEEYLGDVVVSVDAAREEARRAGIGAAARAERLIAHGVLHLLGYDDKDDAGARRMEKVEDRYLGSS